MGCWGITAFESDTGLDAIGLIRNHLPEQGDVKLQQMIDWLRADSWNAPPEVSEGVSHTRRIFLHWMESGGIKSFPPCLLLQHQKNPFSG